LKQEASLEAPRLERRLTAILAADVEGYSRHMERDEVSTLATLSSHRRIVDDLIASHNGRITGTAGDSVLAEFQSVVDALDCAVKVQDAVALASEHPAEFELAFWEAMKDSRDPAELAAYLEQYPAGAFTALAEARRQVLLQEQQAPAEPATTDPDLVAVELAFWDTVKDSDNPAMYEAYLERYPDGAFAALAKVRLSEMQGSRR
jgi:adenylate cyclase